VTNEKNSWRTCRSWRSTSSLDNKGAYVPRRLNRDTSAGVPLDPDGPRFEPIGD